MTKTTLNRRAFVTTSMGAALALILTKHAGAQEMDSTSQASFDTVMAFMGAMGGGDMDAMNALMADDMVWHNEGDTSIPWVHGGITGKQAIFDFLGVFGAGLQTTKWENTDAFASGDTVAVFGLMNGVTTQSGQEIGEFSFALRAKVRDGQVVLWHWFEDSFALSQAYHGRT
ncbi:MAG: nuclear transport factor 2 family protein [Pseudomonadota bacterium]